MKTILDSLGVPGTIVAALGCLWVILQFIGELCELKGKVVPEFFKMRKFFTRKKNEKELQQKLLSDVQSSIAELRTHYSPEALAKRDTWMNWVDSRAVIYDEAVKDLRDLKDTIKTTNELALDMYINLNRNRIIDFASKVANDDCSVSHEEFNRIFKIHEEYESILARYGKKNGEVDVAFRVITEAYEEHLREHKFLEDIRGYK